MKKITALLLTVILCLSVTACGDNKSESPNNEEKITQSNSASTENTSNSIDSNYQDEVLSLMKALLDRTEEYYYGKCTFCGESCDEDLFICDSCMTSDVCNSCADAVLGESDYILCPDCVNELSESITLLDSGEFIPEGYTMANEALENLILLTGIAVEDEKCLFCSGECDADNRICSDCEGSVDCLLCANQLDDGEYILCFDCIDAVNGSL